MAAADFGAQFITFNVDGNPQKARGYFKNIAGTTTASSFSPTDFGIAVGPAAPANLERIEGARADPARPDGHAPETAPRHGSPVSESVSPMCAPQMWAAEIPMPRHYSTCTAKIGVFLID